MPGRRRVRALHLATVVGLVLAAPMRATAAQATPEGFWTTVSDADGKPTSVVEIRRAGDEWVGTVRDLLVPATREDSLCGKCSGDRKGERVIGMEIIRHMHREGDGQWGGGEILDPESGKTYRARMTLIDGGKKLVVRGYIGVSLFGRSQTWLRRE